MHVDFTPQRRRGMRRVHPFASTGVVVTTKSAMHRPSMCTIGARFPTRASATEPAGGAGRTVRHLLGLHAQPANAAADVRAEATLPGPFCIPSIAFL